MDVKELDILGEDVGNHWYYRAKAEAMLRLLGAPGRHVLDVGAGSGVFARRLLEAGAAEATCVDPAYPDDEDTRHAGKALRFRRLAADGAADTVLLMDVLEHVDDDVALLAEYAAPASPGTRFLITVPAFAWMWSGHDLFLEHRRRYTLPQVEQVARAAGLKVARGCYFYGLLLPVAAARRLAGRVLTGRPTEAKSDLKRHGALANTVLLTACRAELPVFPLNRVAGLSVFCLAVKPG